MKFITKVLLPILIFFLTTSVTLAQEPSYTLTRHSINSGGTWSGGGYTLNGIVAQPEASAPRSGGGYTLIGGFMSGAVPPGEGDNKVYLPLILLNR